MGRGVEADTGTRPARTPVAFHDPSGPLGWGVGGLMAVALRGGRGSVSAIPSRSALPTTKARSGA